MIAFAAAKLVSGIVTGTAENDPSSLRSRVFDPRRRSIGTVLLLTAGIVPMLGAGASPTVAERLAALAGDYQGGFHGDAAPGCGFVTELAHPDVWRIESNGDTYRFSVRSPFGNDFSYTGHATFVDGQIVVRGTYVATNVLGRGTFEHTIDARGAAVIVAQSFVSLTKSGCSGTGVDAGVRIGAVGSSKALPSPVPLAP